MTSIVTLTSAVLQSIQLHVAESTIVKHLEHVFSRSGAHSRTEAVRLCGPVLG